MQPVDLTPHSDEEAHFFREGIELFNEEEWFEAHEVWEDAWRMAEGPRKAFYQGLIQCAVTLEHLRRGNPRGVRAVYQTARTKFVRLPKVCMGVDISNLLAEMERVVRPVLQLGPEFFDPARGRNLDLPIEACPMPRIELTR